MNIGILCVLVASSIITAEGNPLVLHHPSLQLFGHEFQQRQNMINNFDRRRFFNFPLNWGNFPNIFQRIPTSTTTEAPTVQERKVDFQTLSTRVSILSESFLNLMQKFTFLQTECERGERIGYDCFSFENSPKATFADAQNFCLHKGGHLAVPSSYWDTAFFEEFIAKFPTASDQNIWIGVSKKTSSIIGLDGTSISAAVIPLTGDDGPGAVLIQSSLPIVVEFTTSVGGIVSRSYLCQYP